MSEPEKSFQEQLLKALKEQTEAINALAASNMAIVDELAAANDVDSGNLDEPATL